MNERQEETINVNTSADDGFGSLRWALQQAEAGGCNRININPLTDDIRIRSALPEIHNNLEINGGDVTISGESRNRIIV
ncbi:MAG: hypothetical protein AB8E74_09055, partial [Prochlorococcus sp.]